MSIENFDAWRDELILSGRIPQDDSPPEVSAQAEQQINRYIELVEMAEGVHEQRVFHALVDSLQVEQDYEVYQTTMRVLLSFPPEQFGQWFAEALPSLILRQPDWAGDFLSSMVNNTRIGDHRIDHFKRAVRNLPTVPKSQIFAFIHAQEKNENGWLKSKPGWYNDVE
jgi:hypothetical protein